tara:strand:+ start:27 stop:554 length:528 start_codon:yes stop_codon:yes gene_type:complete
MNFNAKDIAKKFDSYLDSKGLKFEGVVIGGTALVLLDIITRHTKDFDLINHRIPEDIAEAATEFAKAENLSLQWFNSGPTDLVKHLPNDWQTTTQIIYQGDALTFMTLSRSNLLKAKIWAYCDRTRDYDDILHMAPTPKELGDTAEWLYPLDTNPNWPEWVDECINNLTKGLGHE